MNQIKSYVLSGIFLIVGIVCHSQSLILNEIVAKNATSYENSAGKTPDWIELKNVSSSAIDLSEYSIATASTFDTPIKLPAKQLQANNYYIYEAVSVNNDVEGWVTVVDYGEEFSYKVPQAEINGWTSLQFNDSEWSKGKTPIGYGEIDVATATTDARSVFLRKTFTVLHVEDVAKMMLHMDCDDGFIAYINGTEVARSNMNSTSFDAFATTYTEGVLRDGKEPPSYDVSKGIANLREGENVLCIQLHNCNATSSDLIGTPILSLGYSVLRDYYFSVSKYVSLPSGRSFSLRASGDTVYLLKGAKIIDSISWKNLPIDVSVGRSRTNTVDTYYFKKTTPGTVNSTETYVAKTLDKPKFDHQSGVITKRLDLNVYSNDNKALLRYTTDGSVPTEKSPLVSSSFSIRKNTNLRVRAFRDGYVPSETATISFVVLNKQTLPIASITVDSLDFYDYNTGIYETGPNASKEEPYYGANYWMDWEKPIHLDFFDETGTCVVSQDLGCKIGGNWSRAHPQKTLKLYAREQYGKDEIEYQFFKDKPVSSFHMILLRNSGNDFNNTQMRDGTISELAKEMDIDRQAYQPAIVFINGEYYGIQNVREKQNEHYVAENYGYDKDDIDVVKNGWELKNGSDDDYWEMRDFIEDNDMSSSSNYEKAKKMLDIPSYIDYYVLETYIVNEDWPSNNYGCWHSNSQNTPWRYFLFDCDFGLGIWHLDEKVNKDMLKFCTATNSDNYANTPEATALLRSLMKSSEFRRDYMNATADRLNTTLSSMNVTHVIDSVYGLISAEMPKHIERWGFNWQESNLSKMREFGERREAVMRKQTEEFFSTNGSYKLTLNISENGAGKIHLNTIDVKNFPWSGKYFKNNTIFLTAIPNPGYEFVRWEGAVESENRSISVTSEEATTLTAVFNYVGNEPDVQFTEVYYHAFRNGETKWIELFNNGSSEVDLSGFTITIDRYNQKFTIPDGVKLQSGKYMVFANSASVMRSQYPEIFVVGDLNFDFPKDFATISLLDMNGCKVAGFSYSESFPHARKADGYGFSCELIGEEWFAPLLGGTPGAENDKFPLYPTEQYNLVINEINYASADFADAGDWIELYNPQNAATVNLRNYMICDKGGNCSVIYDDIYIAPGEYVVLANNVQKFKTIHSKSDCHQLSLSLNKFKDCVVLYNPFEFVVDSVAYSMFETQWTKSAFETGHTLALRSFDTDNANGENWSPSKGYGTPGFKNEYITAVDGISMDSVEIYASGHTIFVNHADGRPITVYDGLGQTVARITASTNSVEQIEVTTTGVYFVTVGSQARAVVVK